MEPIKSYNAASVSGWNVALGIWSIISAFILPHGQYTGFLRNNVIVGILIGIVALARSVSGKAGTSGWNVALGAWLVISPFVLGFFHLAVPMWNNIILGIVVAVVAFAGAGQHESFSTRESETKL